MSRFLLLPGMGDRATVLVTVAANNTAVQSDEFDMSRCAQGAVQVTTWAAGDLKVQFEQSFDGTHFSNLGSERTGMAAGDIITLPVTTGPYGIVRIGVRSSDTAATATFTFVGYPEQWSN